MPELKSSRATIINRLLGAAQRPLGDLSAVMASPPTITNPLSDLANSTIQTGQAVNVGMFNASDPTRVLPLGGPLADAGASNGYRPQTLTRGTDSNPARRGGFSSGIAFYTDAATVDFAIRTAGDRWIAYVTTPDGVRARIAAQDRDQAYNNLNYYKLEFGSTAGSGRLIEVYGNGPNGAGYGGINVPTGYNIWPADFSAQPRIFAPWDSFGQGEMNDGSGARYRIKLGVMAWFAGLFGCNNPIVNGLGGTGVIAIGSGYNTFPQRVAAGDMDHTRIGHMDLIFAPGSVNDGNTSISGLAIPAGDATVQAAHQAYIAALMVAQPQSIIVGAPQQFSSAGAAAATRVAAYKAGFLASAAADPRMIWLEGSLFERAPSTGVIGADNTHPDGVYGARHIGERLARQTLGYLRQLV